MVEQTETSVIGNIGVGFHEAPVRGRFTEAQTVALLGAINPARVLHLDGNSHVSQQDIRAHLIRVFGFGNYDFEVVKVELVFEDSSMRTRKRDGKEYIGWDVCYRALGRLSVRNPDGELVGVWEDGSTATAQGQPARGDAHDLAYKSAISLSLKRCAIALGDQFGLSLYNKGQQTALVRGTMVGLPERQRPTDVQEGIEQQVALGNDEVDRPMAEDADVNLQTGEVTEPGDGGSWEEQAKVADTPEALRAIWDGAREADQLTQSVKNAVLARKHALDTKAAEDAKAAKEQPDKEEPRPAAEEPTTTKGGE